MRRFLQLEGILGVSSASRCWAGLGTAGGHTGLCSVEQRKVTAMTHASGGAEGCGRGEWVLCDSVFLPRAGGGRLGHSGHTRRASCVCRDPEAHPGCSPFLEKVPGAREAAAPTGRGEVHLQWEASHETQAACHFPAGCPKNVLRTK